MTAFSDYLEAALLEATLRGNSYTTPASVYIGLHINSTNDDDSGTEVSTIGTNYAREAITFGPIMSGVTSNDTLITFNTATASWTTVTHFGIYDALPVATGNLLYWGALTTSKTVDNGDIFTIPIGNLTVELL